MRRLLWGAVLALAGIALASAAAALHGSFEAFPTGEQQAKARAAYGLTAAAAALLALAGGTALARRR